MLNRNWAVIAFAALFYLAGPSFPGFLACSRVAEQATEPQSGEASAARVRGDTVSAASQAESEGGAPASETLRERYIRTTIEAACLNRREKDPRALARGTHAIYREYGFDDVMDYLAAVKPMGEDESARGEIEEGIRSCP